MAGYNYNPYSGNSAITQMSGANFSMPQPQQLFPRPQGNVYTINNTLEVANIWERMVRKKRWQIVYGKQLINIIWNGLKIQKIV